MLTVASGKPKTTRHTENSDMHSEQKQTLSPGRPASGTSPEIPEVLLVQKLALAGLIRATVKAGTITGSAPQRAQESSCLVSASFRFLHGHLRSVQLWQKWSQVTSAARPLSTSQVMTSTSTSCAQAWEPPRKHAEILLHPGSYYLQLPSSVISKLSFTARPAAHTRTMSSFWVFV